MCLVVLVFSFLSFRAPFEGGFPACKPSNSVALRGDARHSQVNEAATREYVGFSLTFSSSRN